MTRESISTRASSSCPPALRAVRRAAALTLRTSSLNATFRADPVWYRDVEYTPDLARGYEGHEDNFNPGVRGAVAWERGGARGDHGQVGNPLAAGNPERGSQRHGSAGTGPRAQLALGAQDSHRTEAGASA